MVPNSVSLPTSASARGCGTGANGESQDLWSTWDQLLQHLHSHPHHLHWHPEPGQAVWMLSTRQELTFGECCVRAETLKITIDMFRHDTSCTKELLYLLCCGCQYRNLPELPYCFKKKTRCRFKAWQSNAKELLSLIFSTLLQGLEPSLFSSNSENKSSLKF